MTPGPRSFKLGMCLQRSYEFSLHMGYHTIEKLDCNTRFLVGDDNFRKVPIEDCKFENKNILKNQVKMNSKTDFELQINKLQNIKES